jgi:hypothetical protein
VDPNILKETSQEVHDEYLKQFGMLPASKTNPSPTQAQDRIPMDSPIIPTGMSMRETVVIMNSEQMEKQLNQLFNMMPSGYDDLDEDAVFPLAEHFSLEDKPENDTETDNTKIDQILAKVKNSVAEKVDIPGIEYGEEGVTFIESDVDELNVTLHYAAICMLTKENKLRDTKHICVSTFC